MSANFKLCSDCKWVGWGWFLFSPSHRRCHHPLEIERDKRAFPDLDGKPMIGGCRIYGLCKHEGKLWNTNKEGI